MVLSRRPITGTRLLTLITIFKCSAEVGPTGTAYLSTGSRRSAGSRRVLTERFSPATLARARAPVASYPKGEVMKRLLEFLNDEPWRGFRSSSFGGERATRIARGRLGTSCPMAVLVQSVRRESRPTRVP